MNESEKGYNELKTRVMLLENMMLNAFHKQNNETDKNQLIHEDKSLFDDMSGGTNDKKNKKTMNYMRRMLG